MNMTDYAAERAAFTWQPPARFNFARDVFDPWGDRDPSKRMMHWVDDHGHERFITYREMSRRSRQLCNVLHAAGIRRGDTLIVMLPRLVEWWEVLTACLRMGVIASPGTGQLAPKDLAYRIEASRTTAFITEARHTDKLAAIPEATGGLKLKLCVDGTPPGWRHYESVVAAASDSFEAADTAPEDDALCYFTSGTTGYPKMAIQTQGYGLAHQITGRYWLDLTPGDLHWNLSDTGWAKAAWSSYFAPLNCGATLFIHHSETFDPKRTLELLAAHPITTFCGAPTIFRMLVLQDLRNFEFPHLRHVVGAGEPLNPEVIETWKNATGLVIRDGYGQTESILLCASFPCLEPRFGSMGKPSPGITLAVIDDEGAELPPGREGDVAVRVEPRWPPGLFKEYRGDEEKTRRCFRHGWYLTGDRAYMDADGYFWFVGRADDVINSAGYRIGPFEVESALLEHPAVAESAVVSSPDEMRGEVVKAFVVLKPGHAAGEALVKELQEHVKTVTAPYKYPRKIEFVAALPKTVSGKIRRVELRDREWQQG
ncbi:MAG: AMP-binding protein [Gammaproteobacteria bacterium]|nr:AMP-binding protein [Gammaproteobacteria bacterium]